MQTTEEQHWIKAKKLVAGTSIYMKSEEGLLLTKVAADMFKAGYYPLNRFDPASGAAGIENRLTSCIEQMQALKSKAILDQVTNVPYKLDSGYVSLAAQNLFHYVRHSKLRVSVPGVAVTNMFDEPLSEYNLNEGDMFHGPGDVYSTAYSNIYCGISQLCIPELAPVFAGNSALKDLVDETRMAADKLQYHIDSRLEQIKVTQDARKNYRFY